MSSTTSDGSERMSLTQEELSDEVSWAEDTPDAALRDFSSCSSLEVTGQLSIAATESLKLLHYVGRKSS